jgi:four helix bundle protein
MKENLLLQKSFEFASSIVLFYENYSKVHKDNTISKQLLRSGTSIGANINESQYGNSKNDFISKLHISLKETAESIYWIKLLKNTKLLNEQEANRLLGQAETIKRILISSLNTAKKTINQ